MDGLIALFQDVIRANGLTSAATSTTVISAGILRATGETDTAKAFARKRESCAESIAG
jgi:hypothetical protein